MYSVHFTRYTVPCTLYPVHWTLYTLYSVPSTVYRVYWSTTSHDRFLASCDGFWHPVTVFGIPRQVFGIPWRFLASRDSLWHPTTGFWHPSRWWQKLLYSCNLLCLFSYLLIDFNNLFIFLFFKSLIYVLIYHNLTFWALSQIWAKIEPTLSRPFMSRLEWFEVVSMKTKNVEDLKGFPFS